MDLDFLSGSSHSSRCTDACEAGGDREWGRRNCTGKSTVTAGANSEPEVTESENCCAEVSELQQIKVERGGRECLD